MDIVSVLGLGKGGTGKTITSHLLCFGAQLSKRPVNAILHHTDQQSPLNCHGRPYLYYDCRKPENLTALLEVSQFEKGLAVVDGGANQNVINQTIMPISKIILIPMGLERSEVTESLILYNSLSPELQNKTYFVPNRLSIYKTVREREYKKYLAEVPKSKIATTLPYLSDVKIFTDDAEEDGRWRPSTRVRKISKELYDKISGLLRKHTQK